MLKNKTVYLAIFMATTFVIYPQIALSDNFTSAKVLDWSRQNQSFYFQASVTMAGFVASQNDKAQSRCIDDWYFESDGIREQRNGEILNVMGRYPDHHPSAIILAIVQKRCGSLKYTSGN